MGRATIRRWIKAVLFIRTPDVEKGAANVDDLVIKPGGILRHRDWGMYEVGINESNNLFALAGLQS